MSTTSAVSNTSSSTSNESYTDAFSQLTTDDFLKVIISELTNQNPLDSSSDSTSSQLMDQFLQLYTASSMSEMTDGVESQTEQTAALYANTLVGAYVEVASEEGEETTGYVDKAQVEDGEVMITVNGTEYKAANIINIINPSTLNTETTTE